MVGGRFCVDKYEGTLVEQLTDHPDHDSHVDDGIDRIRALFVWTGSVVPPLDRRHGEVAEGRVPGEQVANADAHFGEDSVAVREPILDLSGVLGVVGDEQAIGLLLVPAEAGNPWIAPVEDPRLARGRARREQRHPAIEGKLSRRDQPVQGRHVTAGQQIVQR